MPQNDTKSTGVCSQLSQSKNQVALSTIHLLLTTDSDGQVQELDLSQYRIVLISSQDNWQKVNITLEKLSNKS